MWYTSWWLFCANIFCPLKTMELDKARNRSSICEGLFLPDGVLMVGGWLGLPKDLPVLIVPSIV